MFLDKVKHAFSIKKPADKKKPYAQDQQVLHTNLNFAGVEAYKLLRANLFFMLAAGDEGRRCPVVGVTSSIRGEGKSTTAVNLSYAIAEAGQKVLLIDGDMRLPSIGKKMEIDNAPGLSNELVSNDRERIGIRKSGVLDNWYILPAGDIPPNPSELLASDRLKRLLEYLQERFDFIVLDLPPVDMVSDALVVSSVVDGMIVVVRENYTERADLRECIRQMNIANTRVLGIVFNGVGTDNSGYKYYKSYYKRKQDKKQYGALYADSQENPYGFGD